KITVSDHDKLSHQLEDAIHDGLNLSVTQAFQVVINDGGKEKNVWTTGGSVEELLKSNKITLNELDKIKPGLDETITKESTISIVRVEKKKEEVSDTVAFKTERRNDSSLPKGTEKEIA